MNWFLSIVIGLLTAFGGCFAAAGVASLCVRWYRISSFEGGSGYYVVAIALLGTLVGLVIGIVSSRFIPAGATLAFLKGCGLALGCTGGLALVALFLAWLGADLPPEIDGRSLELALEVQTPVGFTVPTTTDQYGATARVSLVRGRTQPPGELRLKEATLVDGRWVIPATVPLTTSAAQKYMHVYLSEKHNLTFGLPLPSHPRQKHLEWSSWMEAGRKVDEPRAAPEANFHLRYRVMLVEPSIPEPVLTQAEYRAIEDAKDEAEFQAFPATSTIREWFKYTRHGTPEGRLNKAVASIRARPDHLNELTGLILGVNAEDAVNGLYLIQHLQPVPKELVEPVSEFGKHIARALERLNGTSTEPPFGGEGDMGLWFSAWMTALRAMQGRDGVDLTPELHEILRQARKCPSGQIQTHITRVASYYMKEWANVDPLPSDPPPR